VKVGAHMSIEGGLDLAVERAARAGCDVLQIFTKSSNQWKAKDLGEPDVARFRERVVREGISIVAAHDSYLINLASPEETLFRRSLEAFVIELERCRRLGIPYLVAHPGAHVGSGTTQGIRRIASALDEAHAAVPGAECRVLLEITAGQGSVIGSRFEEIAEILSAVRSPESLGVCFDTAHAFAAGYDIRSQAGYEATFREFDRVIGLGRLMAFHLNDSRRDLGSRLDRHEHIGRGWIGREAFRLLVNDPRFASVPMFLETPKGPDLREDIENLATLRSLLGRDRPIAWRPPSEEVARRPSARKSAEKDGSIAPGRASARSAQGRPKGSSAPGDRRTSESDRAFHEKDAPASSASAKLGPAAGPGGKAPARGASRRPR
jgi:deoxyribonuclease-4